MKKSGVASASGVEHVFLRNVAVGETFSGVYYLEKSFIRVAKNGNKFSDLTLRDRSGSVFARFWGEVNASSCWVEASFSVEEYQGNKSIVAQNIAECEEPEDMSNYVPLSETIETDKDSLAEIISSVTEYDAESKNDTCSAILADIFRNGFVKKFETAPASAFPSYGRIGGLLSYTIAVTESVKATALRFGFTAQEKAIALTAALLHRIGAAYAFDIIDCAPKETDRGVLIGSLNIGLSKLMNTVNRINFARKESEIKLDETVADRIMHAMVSAEPDGIKPMTREAIVLQGSVAVVRELSDASDFIANDVNGKETFTAHDPVTKRRYFKG
jgi:23S rRNA maturation-related 3'-5' exoribonuclease YhaM